MHIAEKFTLKTLIFLPDTYTRMVFLGWKIFKWLNTEIETKISNVPETSIFPAVTFSPGTLHNCLPNNTSVHVLRSVQQENTLANKSLLLEIVKNERETIFLLRLGYLCPNYPAIYEMYRK